MVKVLSIIAVLGAIGCLNGCATNPDPTIDQLVQQQVQEAQRQDPTLVAEHYGDITVLEHKQNTNPNILKIDK